MMLKFRMTLISALIIGILACGKATIEPQNASYESRLVIEGFLQANQKADRIFITKNFTVDTDINNFNLIPDPDVTRVTLTDLMADQTYQLSFYIRESGQITEAYWRYEGDDLIITPGRSYRLEVSADFDGKWLQASAVTKVPENGFGIQSINHDQLTYRPRDQQNNLVHFELTYDRSPGTNFYVAAIQAQNPGRETYIYDNPYEEIEPQDVDLIDDAYQVAVAHHTPTSAGASKIKLEWNDFRFYDDYQIILYAADENYKDFFITYQNVMELDGNFHEAKFNIEGDGIGVFGSIIADTISCRVTKE